MIVETTDKVAQTWGKIHEQNPSVYKIRDPIHIGRLRNREFAQIIDRICSFSQHASILEAGCGSGRDTLYFSTLGYRCVALDISPIPLRHVNAAKAQYGSRFRNTSLDLTTITGEVFHLPFSDDSFDLVFNSGVAEHYSEELRRSLFREMGRVTKPQGFVCIAVPNKLHVFEPIWSRLIGRYTEKMSYDIPEDALSAEQLVREMETVGLVTVYYDWIDTYDTISHYPSWIPLKVLNYIARIVLPRPPRSVRMRFGKRIVVIGRKIQDGR